MASYDATTALVVVDMQNDFADPAGSLSVKGGEAIVPFINDEIRTARDRGAFVVYTQDWHPEHTPHFAQDGGIWPVHCVRGTWGAQLHPHLVVDGPTVQKGANGEDGYSGFTMRDPESGLTVATPLEGLLHQAGVGAVVVCGLATDYCVKSTALDALSLGFPTTVLLDGIRAVDLAAGDGDRALEELRAAGAHLQRADADADPPAADTARASDPDAVVAPDDDFVPFA